MLHLLNNLAIGPSKTMVRDGQGLVIYTKTERPFTGNFALGIICEQFWCNQALYTDAQTTEPLDYGLLQDYGQRRARASLIY